MDEATAVETLKRFKEQRAKASTKFYIKHVTSDRERTSDEEEKRQYLMKTRRDRAREYYKKNSELINMRKKEKRAKQKSDELLKN